MVTEYGYSCSHEDEKERGKIMLTGEWYEALTPEFSKPYYSSLYDTVQSAYKDRVVYPPQELIFNALEHTPLSNVKCVIVGQDPYHGQGQAHGLSFSVPDKIAIPPSLVNIFTEIKQEYGTNLLPINGDLTYLADQGVLLLNTSLTVLANKPASHSMIGWQNFTTAILQAVTKKQEAVVYMLWGKHAQCLQGSLVIPNNHLVLTASHPSPYSANISFMGCGHFMKCNKHLTMHGVQPINWIKNWR